jgi:hypothetical protein
LVRTRGGEVGWLDEDKVGFSYRCLKLVKLVGEGVTNRVKDASYKFLTIKVKIGQY